MRAGHLMQCSFAPDRRFFIGLVLLDLNFVKDRVEKDPQNQVLTTDENDNVILLQSCFIRNKKGDVIDTSKKVSSTPSSLYALKGGFFFSLDKTRTFKVHFLLIHIIIRVRPPPGVHATDPTNP